MQKGASLVCLFSFPESVNFLNIEKMKLYINGISSFTKLEKSLEKGEIVFLDESRLQVKFSQEDTLLFFDNEEIKMQFHWLNSDGSAKTSKIIKTNTDEFLGSEAI